MATPEIPGYQLLKQIGSGGMATVFLAIQLSLDRKVAIKVLRAGSEDDPDRTEKRFLREGRTLAKITHKNVCGIYDIAKVGDLAYIAMEYLDGGTLVDKLRVGVSVGESIAIVVQVASALEEAHKLGIIHRDLKPANVMLRGGRVPVLTDFGIARELTATQTRITAENMIVGTPIYMSPEQVSGGEVDGRSDMYALGIMFFELLTGQPPYKGDTPIAVCMQHLTAALPKLPADLADLQPVLDRLLAKKSEERFATMTAFTHALRDVFVTSESLRQVAMFSPDTPWSEQLRDLGFSLDTLRDADVKAALEAQRLRGRSAKPAPRAALDRPVAARRWLPILTLALLLMVVSAGLLLWSTRTQPPTETEMLALTQLRSDFAERMAQGKLFEPPDGSALDAVNKMRKIHATDAETITAKQILQRGAVDRAGSELGRRDLIALDATLTAIAQGLPDLPELAQLTEQRAALAASLAGEAAMRARVARLKALLDGAPLSRGESVIGLYLDLRPALANDSEFKSLEPRALAASRLSIEVAMAGGDEVGALANAERLASVFAQDASLLSLVNKLKADIAGAQIQRLSAEWRQILGQGALDSARLADLLKRLAKLRELGQADAEQTKMRAFLVDFLLKDAKDLAKKGQPDAALAIIGQGLAGLGAVASLSDAQREISTQREQAELAQRTADQNARLGQIAISSAPWANIESIVDAGGRKVALPAQASTPLLLTLPEGRYQITVAASQGGARRQEAFVIERGKLANLSLRFTDYGADQFLREVGW